MKETLVMCFLYGIIFKLYDDIIDNKLKVNQIISDFLCYLSSSFISLICYKSPIFSIIWTEMAGVSAIMDYIYTYKFKEDTEDSKDFTCMNDNLWIYTLCVSTIFTIYHISDGKLNWNTNSYKTCTFLAFAIINFLIVVLDIYLTPEHSSQKKFYARTIVFFIIMGIVITMIKYNDYFYNGTIGIMLMNLGFLTSSLIYMSLENTSVITKLKPKIKKKKSKHKKNKLKNSKNHNS